MKAPLWALAVAMTPMPAAAGTLICSFTEPFFSIAFDSATGKVVETSADVFDPGTGQPVPTVLAEHARLRVADPQRDPFSLVLENGGETILVLQLTGHGSDGMSDNLFPFQAMRGGRDGGCETYKYPAFDTYELLLDLGISP